MASTNSLAPWPWRVLEPSHRSTATAGQAGWTPSGVMAKTMQMAGLLLSTSSEPERGQGDGRGELADRTGRNDRKGGWDWGSRGEGGGWRVASHDAGDIHTGSTIRPAPAMSEKIREEILPPSDRRPSGDGYKRALLFLPDRFSSFFLSYHSDFPRSSPTSHPLLTDPSSLVSTALLIVLQHLDLFLLEDIPNQPLPPFLVPLYSPF